MLTDHNRAAWVVAGQGRAGQGRAGQGRAGQGRAGQGRAGQGRAGQGRAGQGRAGQSLTGIHHDITAEVAMRQRDVQGSDPAVRVQNAGCIDHHVVVITAVYLLHIARS